MTQLSKVKQNIHQHKDKSWNLKKHKKSNSRRNQAVWTVFVNCAQWRGSTLAIYKTVLIIFPLNLQTIIITLNVVKWRCGGSRIVMHPYCAECASSHRHTTVSAIEGFSAAGPRVRVCHLTYDTTWTSCISSINWKHFCLGIRQPRRIETIAIVRHRNTLTYLLNNTQIIKTVPGRQLSPLQRSATTKVRVKHMIRLTIADLRNGDPWKCRPLGMVVRNL